MKNKMIMFLLMLLSLVQLYLIKDSGVFHIISRTGFFLFFLFSFINSFCKKQNKIGEKIFLFIAFINIIYSIVSIFIDDVSMGLYNTVLAMMEYYLFNKIFKKKDNMNKLLVCVYLLNIVPIILLKDFSLSSIYSIIFGLFLVIFFRKSDKNKKNFKLYEWYKYISLISVAIIYFYYPVIGGIFASIVGLLSFAGAFEAYNQKRENPLYDKKVKKNTKYILTRKIYHYASSEKTFFDEQLKQVVKRTFLSDDVPYELYAIMTEINERNSDKRLVMDFKNKKELINRTSKLLDAKVRPEVVTYMIMEGIKKRDLTEKKKDKLYKSLEKVLGKFDSKYIKVIDSDDEDKLGKVESLYSEFCLELLKAIDKLNI